MTARLIAILAIVALAACKDEAAREQACADKLVADFESSGVFGRERSLAAPWASDEAMSWQEYALTAAESAVAIRAIYIDDDRNACDYVSVGNRLERR